MSQGERANRGMLRRFSQRWGMQLSLPAELRAHVEGHIVEWTARQVQEVETALAHLPDWLIRAASVCYLFVDEDLHLGGHSQHGVAYDLDADEPKWIGLHTALFTQQEQEPWLGVPLLWARLFEEIVHVWDYRLEAAGSRYASANVDWLQVECDDTGHPRPFAIPNRKDYDLIAEDWALALLWYVWQPDALQRCSPERYAFVARLWQENVPS